MLAPESTGSGAGIAVRFLDWQFEVVIAFVLAVCLCIGSIDAINFNFTLRFGVFPSATGTLILTKENGNGLRHC